MFQRLYNLYVRFIYFVLIFKLSTLFHFISLFFLAFCSIVLNPIHFPASFLFNIEIRRYVNSCVRFDGKIRDWPWTFRDSFHSTFKDNNFIALASIELTEIQIPARPRAEFQWRHPRDRSANSAIIPKHFDLMAST